MEILNIKTDQPKVLMFPSKGYSQSEIARKLTVMNQSTVSRDLTGLRKKAMGSKVIVFKEIIPAD